MALADEIAVKLGLTTTQFRTALKEANADVQAFKAQTQGAAGVMDGFGKAFDKAFSAEHIGKSLLKGAATLGLAAFSAGVEAIVDHFRKAAETAQELERLSSQAAEATIAAARARNTDETNYQLLLEDRRRLEEAIANNHARTDEQRKQSYLDQIALGKVLQEQQALGEKIEQDNMRKSKDAADAYWAQVKKVRDEQLKAQEEVVKKQQEEWERRLKAAKTEEDIQREIKKLKFEALTPEAQVTDLVAQQRALVIQIAYNKKQGLGYSKEELELMKVTNELAEKRKKLEHEVTAEKRAQVAAQKEADQRAALANLVLQDTLIVNGKAYGPSRDPRSIEQASEKELAALIRQNLAEIKRVKDSEGTGPSALADAATGYLIQGSVIARLQTDINRAQFQLSQRSGIRNNAAAFGEDNARARFGGDPLAFDNLLAVATRQQTEQTKTNQLLDDLNSRLGAAGLTRR